MKFLAVALLVLSLSACRNEPIDIVVDSTLECVTTDANGKVESKRSIPFRETFTARFRQNVGWTFRDGAWVMSNIWLEDSKVWKSVTPFPGESCIPT